MSLSTTFDSISEDIDAVDQYAEELYKKYFGDYFITQKRLNESMKNGLKNITDGELEQILTSLPLELFEVSEKLNKLKLNQEVIKMKTKEKEIEIQNNNKNLSDSKRKEKATEFTLEYKLMSAVYNSVLSRVESEISFSRELIMSAKKLWDRRSHTESVNPIGPVNISQVKPQYVSPSVSTTSHYIQ